MAPSCSAARGVIAHLLLLAGDVERNPGPINRDAKPVIKDCLYMSYTGEDGKIVHFRLMDRIKPRVTRLAIALNFPDHIIADMKTDSDPVYFLLTKWLRGDNQEEDSRPLTWGTLITALGEAGLMEEAKILEEQFVAVIERSARKRRHPYPYPEDHEDTPPAAAEGSHSVEVPVKSGLVKNLCRLNEEYAGMLMVLQRTEISEKSLHDLRVFLSGLCTDVSFKSCSSLECVVELLELKSKIFLFNIEPLVACCRCRRKNLYQPFFEGDVCRAVLGYKVRIKRFQSGITLKNFRCSLREAIKDINGMAEVTLKLNETVSSDTADILEKLPFQLFGVVSKALLLCEVRTGCVCVTWCVPTSLVPTLREKAEQLSPEYLASKGVLELVIGLRIAPYEAVLSGHTTSSVNSVLESNIDIATDSGDPYSGEQQAMGVANNDMMIAEILKGKEVDLMKLREDYENRCGQLQLELQEVFEQNAKLAAYYKKKINSIEEQKKELASELETVRKEELVYEVKFNELEVELKKVKNQSFHFEEKSERLQKEIELLYKRPTLKDLSDCLLPTLAPYWKEFCIAVNFDEDGTTMKIIDQKCRGNPEECCREVFMKWLKQERPTWQKVFECLRDAHCEQLADKVREQALQLGTIHGQSKPISLLPPSEGIRAYQRELAQPGLDGKNYIICAPTGSGKTLVAAMIISEHLKKGQEIGEERKVLFLVKTQLLAHQQKDQLEKYVIGARTDKVVGEEQMLIAPILSSIDLIVCTAGKIRNELENKTIHISQFSLLVVDECHHTVGNDQYSEVLEFYLMAKLHGSTTKVPQVVGLTASPGVGKGRSPSIFKAITHQLELCACLDASSGIKMVTENSEELKSYMNKPEHILTELKCRDSSDPFTDHVIQAMVRLETMIKDGPSVNRRNSPQYKRWVDIEKEAAELRKSPEERDRISVLQYLAQYCLALTTYEDFSNKDAIDVLKETKRTPDHQATPIEQSLRANHEALLQQVSQLPPVSNPLLEGVERILHDQFTAKPESKAIFFVREIRHTRYVHRWIESRPSLRSLIRASTIIGSTRAGMTKEEQYEAIQGFRSEKYNLLVSTSVLEEGIDVAACNLVIRFQTMTNEIAEVQAQGRARALESKMYTIMSSQSEKQCLQLINEEKKLLALEAPSFVTELCRTHKFEEKQQIILAEREARERANAERKLLWKPEDVDIVCKKCQIVACKGSDVYKLVRHFVVPDVTFHDTKMVRKPHHKPSVHGNMHSPYKIFCKNCNHDWGVWSIWSDYAVEFPVLRCAAFNFRCTEFEKAFQPGKKWSTVPFEILSLPMSFYEEA